MEITDFKFEIGGGRRPFAGRPGDCPDFRQTKMGLSPLGSRRPGFTLVELLIVITIIGMLAALSLGALQKSREAARRAKTNAMIAKLNDIMMRKYESYMTRRVPVNTAGLAGRVAARVRLDAIRDLMRMEMPERWSDIFDEPTQFSWGSVPRPAISRLYKRKHDAKNPDVRADGSTISPGYAPAECLYLTVMSGSADARAMFSADEIGDSDGDGWPEFHDGWGNPIMWLRWAPKFTPWSEIQKNDAEKCHDPFDSSRLDSGAYQLIPLIYSSGGNSKDMGVRVDDPSAPYRFKDSKDPYASPGGEVTGGMPITNHLMEQR